MIGEKTLEKLIEWNPVLTGIGMALLVMVIVPLMPLLVIKILFG